MFEASHSVRRGVEVLLICFIAVASAFAQSTTGGVNGTITDTTGAVVAGTSVTLSNVENGVEVTTEANSSGFFVFVNVQPGNYTLVSEQTGFKSAVLPVFNVGVNQTVTQNIALEVGNVTETIEVMAQAEQLQQSTSELGTVIGVKEVEDLPLNGRNFTQLLTLTPGATPVSTAQSSGIGSNDLANVGVPGASFSNPSIHGQWNRMNIHLLDGVNNTNYIGNMYVIPPIIDAIEEFKVQSHNDKAEFGGVLGGIINVISKTGTNEFHGSLWEFVRNDALNARDPFADEFNVKPAAFRQNQYGAAVGGPIIRNKTFFHFAYEGWRFSNPRSNRYYVPTDAQLNGDFSNWPTGQDIYDPLTTRMDPDTGGLVRDQYPGNIIPAASLNQSMQTYLRGYYDTPNLQGDPQFNVINQDAATNDADNFQVRFDHQFSELDRAWFRYSKIDGAQLTPSTQLINEVGEFPFFNYGGGWFHSFSPTVIMDHSFGYAKEPYRQGTLPDDEIGDGPAVAAGFGTIDGVQPIPRIAIGSGGFAGGDVGSLRRMEGPLEFHYEQFHYTGNLSWIRGNHTLKFGFQTLRHTLTPGSTGSLSFNFTKEATQGQRPEEVGGTGDPLASALIGVPSQVSGGLPSSIFFGYQTFGAYAQDEWRIRPNLTLNIGLRFDHLMWPDVESDTGRFKTNYDLASGDFLIGLDSMPPPCNQSGIAPCIPGDGLEDVPFGDKIRLAGHTSIGPIPVWDNWQPRFGLAWSMDPTTVLRIGYGIVFDQLTGVNQSWQGSGGWPSNDGFFEPTNAPGEPVRFVEELRTKLGSPLPGPQPWGDTCWCVDHNNKNPLGHQWNVELQRQVSQNLVLSAGYVGSTSTRLQITGLANTAQPGLGTPEEVQARKPQPHMPTVFWGDDRGWSNYHGVELKADRRFSNGLSFLASYTWSRAIDNGASGFFNAENGPGGGSAVQDFYNLSNNEGVAGYNIPHFLSLSSVWELPAGKGKGIFNRGPAAWVLGNWHANSLFQIRSGQPVNMVVNGDVANIGNEVAWWSYMRPNLVGDPNAGTRTSARWFNTDAFETPAFGSFGNAGRGLVYTETVTYLDFSLFKRFAWGDSRWVEVRSEFFNLLNLANYGPPDSTVLSQTMGRVVNTVAPMRQVQFGLKIIF